MVSTELAVMDPLSNLTCMDSLNLNSPGRGRGLHLLSINEENEAQAGWRTFSKSHSGS